MHDWCWMAILPCFLLSTLFLGVREVSHDGAQQALRIR